MYQNNRIYMCIIFLLLINCGGGSGEQADGKEASTNQEYYFEVVYLNYAWGVQHHGLFINNNGEVYTYNVSDTTAEYSETDSSYPESVLTDKFNSNKVYKESISLQTLQDMSGLIALANGGTLSDPTHIAYDAGTYLYRAFIYNHDDNTYSPVFIYQTGEFEITNSAPEAVELKNWLDTIQNP